MKFTYSYNTHQNERREGLVISAPNRDAAYSELNKRGIRPYKLEPVPGLWNKLLSLGWRNISDRLGPSTSSGNKKQSIVQTSIGLWLLAMN